MNSKLAVKVTGLRKEFILPQHRNTSIKQSFVNILRKNKKVTQTVLDDVSFEVKKGDFFGIVGRNGSGKSTLLKILAGVYTPTEGGIEMNGKLTPFIELGVGFNPELSGRDNVFLNGALLGFTRTQMREMYDDIVAFAELEPFMDQKLKNYSSGMQVRLAFSIAIKAKNEILIFDEVLAVGDEAFQQKCLDVFEKYKAEKQTVILVTHDMETVRKFCTRALVLDSGNILQIGDPNTIASVYTELNLNETERNLLHKSSVAVNNEINLKTTYKNTHGNETALYKCGDALHVVMTYQVSPRYQFLVLNIYKQTGEHLTGFRFPTESGRAEIEIAARFSKGKYFTLFQPINSKDEAVGDVIVGPEFAITTSKAPGIPGWSGLVPVDYKITKS